ncbi:helix-turn-helix domain-containing protein [Nonomuraea sp. NPDC050227]|uniref:helix-turn-helix domain-containing protein n=1 Tax=Nonomuraea sp. NPDC050227 TaxID=3364360 RepID=UPI003789CC40
MRRLGLVPGQHCAVWEPRRLVALGIEHRTGYRWRAESGRLPPVRLAESARSSRFLSLLDRQRGATSRAQGLGVRAIADRLGRYSSTISRELRRNALPHDRGVYDGDLAHARVRQRARGPRQGQLPADAQLRAEVQAKLEQDWPRADRCLLAQYVSGPAEAPLADRETATCARSRWRPVTTRKPFAMA